MTAPGQEPDEVITATPEKTEDSRRSPKLDDIGDSHMPEDLREAEHEKAGRHRGTAPTGESDASDNPSDDSADDET